MTIQIKEVEFLVPVKMRVEVDGQEKQVFAHLNFIHQKLRTFDDPSMAQYATELETQISQILNNQALPERTYEASQEIYDNADKAYDDFKRKQEGDYGQ